MQREFEISLSAKKHFLLFAALVFAGNWLIVNQLSKASPMPVPEWPLAFDLLLMIPLCFLWLNRKQGRQAWIGALALFSFGILFGSWILPNESKQLWSLLEPLRFVILAGIVLTQASLIFLIFTEVLSKKTSHNLDIALNEAISKRLGENGFASLMNIEARMWLYALLRKPIGHSFPGNEHFEYHLHQGNASNQQGFLILIAAEIPIAHLLLHFYSPTLAIFVTVTSIYGFLFLLAEYRATLYRPISIEEKQLYIRYGVIGDQPVAFDQIASVGHCDGKVRRAGKRLRFTGPQHANIHIVLKPDTELDTLLGKKVIEEIYIAVDKPEYFIQMINACMSKQN